VLLLPDFETFEQEAKKERKIKDRAAVTCSLLLLSSSEFFIYLFLIPI